MNLRTFLPVFALAAALGAAVADDFARDVRPLVDQFWGYWGTCLDRFGIRWMFNGPEATPTA